MEETVIHIFESLAYPIAVSVVLFLAIGSFAKKMLADIHSREESSQKLRDQYIAYLQMANVELTGAVKENATAFNKFSAVLEKLERTISRITTQTDHKGDHQGEGKGGQPH